MSKDKTNVISAYMAHIGSKGGRKTGPSKARDSKAMRAAAKKRWANKEAQKV